MKHMATNLVSARLGSGLTALAVAMLLSVRVINATAADLPTQRCVNRRVDTFTAGARIVVPASRVAIEFKFSDGTQRQDAFELAAGETRPIDPKPIVNPTPEKPPKLRIVSGAAAGNRGEANQSAWSNQLGAIARICSQRGDEHAPRLSADTAAPERSNVDVGGDIRYGSIHVNQNASYYSLVRAWGH